MGSIILTQNTTKTVRERKIIGKVIHEYSWKNPELGVRWSQHVPPGLSHWMQIQNLAACTEQKLWGLWKVNSGRQIKEDQNMKPWTGNEFIIFILWSSPTWSQMCGWLWESTWTSGLNIALAFIFSGWRTKKSNHRELKSIREIMESEELGRIYKFLGSALSCSLIDLVFIHT